MKIKFLKNYNRLLAFLLSFLGFAGVCATGCCEYGTMEYGTPNATFKVHGTVKSEENVPVSRIRVVMRDDTSFSDYQGEYEVQYHAYCFEYEQGFTLEFDDIDGIENGRYSPLDTVVTFTDPQFEGGDDSWYDGETSKELNINLEEDI